MFEGAGIGRRVCSASVWDAGELTAMHPTIPADRRWGALHTEDADAGGYRRTLLGDYEVARVAKDRMRGEPEEASLAGFDAAYSVEGWPDEWASMGSPKVTAL